MSTSCTPRAIARAALAATTAAVAAIALASPASATLINQYIEVPLTKGNHVIGVQAEGVEGGCNTGSVGAWGGNLLVRTLYDDTNAGMLPPPP